jgi:stage II sporulation protein E
VDLATSIVDFVKLGATASFIKHQDTITKIESGALPVGILDEISPKITKTSVNYGDMIILTSDGITDSFGEEELERFVLENQSLSPQELADNILTKAKALCGGMPIDDMTVLIGKIFKNHQ